MNEILKNKRIKISNKSKDFKNKINKLNIFYKIIDYDGLAKISKLI